MAEVAARMARSMGIAAADAADVLVGAFHGLAATINRALEEPMAGHDPKPKKPKKKPKKKKKR